MTPSAKRIAQSVYFEEQGARIFRIADFKMLNPQLTPATRPKGGSPKDKFALTIRNSQFAIQNYFPMPYAPCLCNCLTPKRVGD